MSTDNVVEFPGRQEEQQQSETRIEVRAGELPQLVHRAETALLRPPGGGIYQRGGQLVRIVRLDTETEQQGVKRAAGSIIIHSLSRDYLVLALARAASWIKYDGRTRGYRPIDPPGNVAGALLSAVGEWRFPVLRGLTAAPTLRADGTLLAVPGYDPVSGLYAAFDPTDFPPINPAPTREDALAALDLLDDLFSECAFAGGDRSAHASVAIAATITAVLRHALPIAPAYGISAHKQGSGKTTVARAIAHICTGREPPVLALTDDEKELRKCLLGILIAGDACVLIDNVAHPVDSAALCAMLTSATYSDRVMGVNTKVEVPTASTWLITGNHLEFIGDLTSRVLLSVLDPEVEHPEARPFKRDLAAYVAEQRGRLLAAALTVPLAYLAAGAAPSSARRSRFAEWDRLVRRPMLWLGCADPLDTQEELRATDPVRESLIAVLQAWSAWQEYRLPDSKAYPHEGGTVAQAISAATVLGQSTSPQQEQLREALAGVAGEKDGRINPRRLGRYLVKNLRQIESGMRLEDAGKDELTHRRRFKVTSRGVSGVSGVSLTVRARNANSGGRSQTNADNAGNAVEGRDL